MIEFDHLTHPDPEEGTYDGVEVNEPAAAIAAFIETLPQADKDKIAEAGFSSDAGFDGPSIYLAIRAQEILEFVEQRRGEVAVEMRAGQGGSVVTDADVMNRVIDELSPEDRAVLKTKKYLVNVRRFGVSTDMAQVRRYKRKVPVIGEDGPVVDDAGKPVTEQQEFSVFTGYQRQHPIAPIANQRAVARARMTAVEGLMQDVQDGVAVRTELDYERTSAVDVASASRLDIVKAVRPGLPIGFIDIDRRG